LLNVTEETHRDLYYDIDKCVSFCRDIPNEPITENVDFHMFWRVGKDFGRKQTLPIKSYLCTQNLEKTKLNVWSNVDLTGNSYLKPFLPYVNFKIWNPQVESKDTPVFRRSEILNAVDELNWASGDLFRILCLHKYGGLYADFDVVFLRDLAPVLQQEFMYKWSFQEYMINGAVMRMFKGSLLGKQLLSHIARVPRHGGTAWSTDLYQEIRKQNKDWTVFPCGFFNTEWQIASDYRQKHQFNDFQNDELTNFIRDPMKKTAFSSEFFDGVFTWHWHNCWDNVVEDGSKWELLERKFDSEIKQKFNL
jgi:hypothetical protein